ncbi:hypothetical protein PUN28_007047 [Cardiocondyla obscurior]|uniref:Uncharacterized protein n=1 Tax=Cardiocondyla obscurior TaxID=286306 RepID=A0AAW2G6A7_9HYME
MVYRMYFHELTSVTRKCCDRVIRVPTLRFPQSQVMSRRRRRVIGFSPRYPYTPRPLPLSLSSLARTRVVFGAIHAEHRGEDRRATKLDGKTGRGWTVFGCL